jgi:archaemetzincin
MNRQIHQKISIISIDEIGHSILQSIGRALEQAFGYSCEILPGEPILSHVPGLLHEDKYNSTALLLYLSKRMPKDSLKSLAVTQLDLYSPIFSSLYGEAQLGGRCALMSLYRLRQEFYRQKPDRRLLVSRCIKEALHEIGHTFGLVHCIDKNCIMFPSSTIEDTDIKSDSLCPVCTRSLVGI